MWGVEVGLKLTKMVCILCSRLTLSETNSIQRESYKQQQVVHFTVQRSLSQTLKLGSNSRTTTQHQLPIINTSKDLHPVTQHKPVTPEVRNDGVLKHERSAVSQYVTEPIRVNFRASSLMSSPGETSQRALRRQ